MMKCPTCGHEFADTLRDVYFPYQSFRLGGDSLPNRVDNCFFESSVWTDESKASYREWLARLLPEDPRRNATVMPWDDQERRLVPHASSNAAKTHNTAAIQASIDASQVVGLD